MASMGFERGVPIRTHMNRIRRALKKEADDDGHWWVVSATYSWTLDSMLVDQIKTHLAGGGEDEPQA